MNQSIGSYKIIRSIGAGGMAQVFEARNSISGQVVALKMLASHARDPADLRRFEREAQVLRRLSHPNIITIYDIGTEQGRPYIAMELLDQSLEGLLQSGPLSADRAMKLLIPVLDALDHAHQYGLVHRDIKSANVLLRSNGSPVLADFDLARPQSVDPHTRITVDGELLGTPAYMAPEQLRGAQLDARTDLYACGAMLFEMLSGRMPFEGNLGQIITGQLQDVPPDLLSLAPNTPAALAELVERLLAKEPDQRPYSAAVVRDALEAIRKRSVMPPLSPPTKTPPLPRASQSPRLAARPTPRLSSLNIITIVIGIGSSLLLFGLLFFAMTRAPIRQVPAARTSVIISTATVVETAPAIMLGQEVTPESSPTITLTPVPRPTILPGSGTLTEVGAVLLTDPQIVEAANGMSYVIGSVGISEVAQTGVFILSAEVMANQASNGHAKVDVALHDREGTQLATGTGLTLSPFIEPYRSSALVLVLTPKQSISMDQAITREFTMTVLPDTKNVLALEVEPGAEATALDGSVPTYKLSGRILNQQKVGLTECMAVALLYDEEFRVIAAESFSLQADGQSLDPGASLSFDKALFSPGPPAVGYRVYAYGEVVSP